MIEQLITLCKENGLEFGSLSTHGDGYIVTVHDPKLAGRKPVLSEKRDALDYQFDMDSWKRRGMVVLAISDTPTNALQSAIEYFQEK